MTLRKVRYFRTRPPPLVYAFSNSKYLNEIQWTAPLTAQIEVVKTENSSRRLFDFWQPEKIVDGAVFNFSLAFVERTIKFSHATYLLRTEEENDRKMLCGISIPFTVRLWERRPSDDYRQATTGQLSGYFITTVGQWSSDGQLTSRLTSRRLSSRLT